MAEMEQVSKIRGGELQDGGGDVLAAALVDLETHAVRLSLGLPSGDLHADKKEAFDTQWKDEVVFHLQDRAGIQGRALLLADALDCQKEVLPGGWIARRKKQPVRV